VFELLGVAGIAISVMAYVPQVVHLVRERCSAGVSRRAWAMWVLGSVLVGTLAVHRTDHVFILLQISTLTAAATILGLAHRYAERRAKVTQIFTRPSMASGREHLRMLAVADGSRAPSPPVCDSAYPHEVDEQLAEREHPSRKDIA
jgi:lipid-A-disaccharide synthase-like uncharacterized protein